MGRKKLKLERIECPKERSSKYSKRKKGILKKAEELALLCNISILMILISPTEKPTLFHTPSRSLCQILKEFLGTSIQEREERRAYTTKMLKKVLVEKKDEEVPIVIDYLSPDRGEVIQDDKKVTELRETRRLLNEKTSILEGWKNVAEVNDLGRLNIMENYLASSISHIRNILKVKIQEEQQTVI
ncbi:PREDICTED: agamous-like MADS-box protein AGL65 [Camelina sativa]|uniref:Agamous-like MADS-box protein AGL65 n=1 Tax=Camelina sativa TaxID=90675 RepID=A0ABM0WL64_CAMSA|nr:PREDICTED: agamous-like MADS-box protein AGL65 [Camelina sativa]